MIPIMILALIKVDIGGFWGQSLDYGLNSGLTPTDRSMTVGYWNADCPNAWREQPGMSKGFSEFSLAVGKVEVVRGWLAG
jgi:hypothetical protein